MHCRLADLGNILFISHTPSLLLSSGLRGSGVNGCPHKKIISDEKGSGNVFDLSITKGGQSLTSCEDKSTAGNDGKS